MTNQTAEALQAGIDRSRQFTRQQLCNAAAMLLGGLAAYFFVISITGGFTDLALAVAASTGLTVGVCCAPDSYRDRGGSLKTAIGLLAAMWILPVVMVLLSLFA